MAAGGPGQPGYGAPFGYAPQPAYGRPAAAPSRGGLQTVFDEQLLSITLVVEIVKLSPGN